MSKPKRIQGSFVSEKEIKRIVSEIKRQAGAPQYLDGITEKQKVAGGMVMGNGSGGGDDDDPLLEEAKEIIINAGKASATMLQKYLSIGYARASRLMDLLEMQGIIGPGRGAKPREILVNKGEYSAGMTMSGMPLHNPAEMQAPEEYFEEVADEDSEDTADAQGFGESMEDDEDNEPKDEIEDNDEEDNEEIDNDIEEVEPIFTEPEEDEVIEEEVLVIKKSKNSFEDMDDSDEDDEDPSVVVIKKSKVSKTVSAKSSGVSKTASAGSSDVSKDDEFDHYFSR